MFFKTKNFSIFLLSTFLAISLSFNASGMNNDLEKSKQDESEELLSDNYNRLKKIDCEEAQPLLKVIFGFIDKYVEFLNDLKKTEYAKKIAYLKSTLKLVAEYPYQPFLHFFTNTILAWIKSLNIDKVFTESSKEQKLIFLDKCLETINEAEQALKDVKLTHIANFSNFCRKLVKEAKKTQSLEKLSSFFKELIEN